MAPPLQPPPVPTQSPPPDGDDLPSLMSMLAAEKDAHKRFERKLMNSLQSALHEPH